MRKDQGSKKNSQKASSQVRRIVQKENKPNGIKKQYLKTKDVYRVTFTLPKVAVPKADSASVVGEFNNWDNKTHSMRKLKNGSFTLTLDLKPGREYQYRYLIDNSKWENDWKADKYVPSPFGGDNSVISL